MRRTYKQAIQEEWLDSDGYWIALKPGLMDNGNPHCHTIHEDTKKEAYQVLQSVVPCTCSDCRTGKL